MRETTNLSVDNMIGDDRYYVKTMKEILEAFPNKGPPFFPVALCSHVYIGNQRNADDHEDLARLGITHVLNCAGTRRFDLTRSPYPASSGIKGYLMIPAEDHDHYDIMQHFQDAISFLEKCRQSGGKALVHCNLGVNRSGAICAAYLMVYEHKPLLEVIQHLKDKRQFILCNKNFRRQVMRFARCKGLLDPVKHDEDDSKPQQQRHQRQQQQQQLHNNKQQEDNNKGANTSQNRDQRCYSTNSLDRANYTRNHSRGDTISVSNNRITPGATEDNTSSSSYNSLPRRARAGNISHNYVNSIQNRFDGHGSSNSTANNFQLESVPERKPISDFVPSRSKYDSESGPAGAAPTSGSAPPTPKTVTFRRPTVSDVSKDTQRVRSSPSASPKLGFLSRIGTKITRQRSLTNLSRTSADDDFDDKPAKRSSLKNSKESLCQSTTDGDIDTSLSTSRPLRIYKRSSTDTELYRKPSSLQSYRRAETIASADTELERHTAGASSPSSPSSAEDQLLPQEFLYHSRGVHARYSAGPSSVGGYRSKESGPTTVNLLARLKPVGSRSKGHTRTNSLQ